MSNDKTNGVKEVTALYQRGIAAALAEEYISEAAVGYELLADYLSRIGQRGPAIRENYSKAAFLYEKWGAKVKRRQLLDRVQNMG